MASQRGSLGEFELIRRFFQRDLNGGATPPGVRLGIGDDAAILSLPAGTELVAAVDTLVAGHHFPPGTDPRSIGYRAIAVNLSDLAAMGATPAWATLALTLPEADEEWLRGFSVGLMRAADEAHVALVGGDTTRGPLTVSVQILGHVVSGSALRRGGGRAGDLLVVTGTLGDAAAGLRYRISAPPAAAPRDCIETLIGRFEYPTARVRFGAAARGIASAAMDLSDGLAGDAPKLAAACGLAARIAVEQLPISEALRTAAAESQAREWALCGGEDYELLLAVPRSRLGALQQQAAQLNLRLTVVGELSEGRGVTWSLNGGHFEPSSQGYDHFAQASTQITV